MPKRGGDGDEDQGGGAEPERKENPTENGAEAQTKRKLVFFFLVALCARGRKHGQCRPQRRGRHLHGSPVRAQKPADGESESFRNLKATNYKK